MESIIGPNSPQIHSVVIQGPNVDATAIGNTVTASWKNALGCPIYVTSGYVFVGESMGGRSDTAVWMLNATSGDVYLVTNWDHYADPVAIESNIIRFNVSPNWFLVNPGDEIVIQVTITGPYPPETAIPSAGSLGVLYYLQ